MAIVHERDTIQGSTASWNLTDGITLIRRFIVKELTGNRSAIVYNAIRAGGIPRPGDPHPDVVGSYVDTVTANPLGATICEVLVSYKPFKAEESNPEDEEKAFQTKRISATVQSAETNLYFDEKNKKKVMTVEYEWPEGDSPGQKNPDTQVGTVTKEVPSIVISINKIEKEDPFDKIVEFQGKVNSTAFARGGKRQWLLSNIEAETNDDGETWTVQYQFQYNPDKWDATVAYVDPRTNKPPSDVQDQENALKQFRVYEEVDFRKLNLGG